MEGVDPAGGARRVDLRDGRLTVAGVFELRPPAGAGIADFLRPITQLEGRSLTVEDGALVADGGALRAEVAADHRA